MRLSLSLPNYPQAFYTVRSERRLMERLKYNLLFRWFVVANTQILMKRRLWVGDGTDSASKLTDPLANAGVANILGANG